MSFTALLLTVALSQSAPTREAPASIYAVSWPIDGVITGLSGLGILAPYAFGSGFIDVRCPCDAREVNTFDRPAIGQHSLFADRLSDVTVALLWLAPVLGDFLDVGLSRAFAEDMLVFAEVLAVNGVLVTATKYAVQRPLPLTYVGDPELVPNAGGYRSFYSGHTSNAFAALSFAAMTLRLRHGEMYWPWVVAALAGSSVAIERVLAGRHFATDVIVGALAGSAVGILVPWLHARLLPAQTAFFITPTPALDGALVGVRLRLD